MRDDGIVTHAAVVALLPRSIRNDFLSPIEQDFAFVCAYPSNQAGFLTSLADARQTWRLR